MHRQAKGLDANGDPQDAGHVDELGQEALGVHLLSLRQITASGPPGLVGGGKSSLVSTMHRYALGEASLELGLGDITESDTTAIANAANSMLMGGGGVDGAIHRAAGPGLARALLDLKRDLPGGVLETGGAVITPGFALRSKWVIHCVGPIYDREGEEAAKLLGRCYAKAIELCRRRELESIAFPSISTGVYGYPSELAAPVALEAVRRALGAGPLPKRVRFVLFDEPTLAAYRTGAERLFG